MSFSENEEIKEYYSEWWENPRDIRNAIFNSLNEYVRQRIPAGNGKKALDIGSGHGRILSYLIEKEYDVTAVEFNESFVKELKDKFPCINVISEDVRNIDFEEEFDVVTCIELVQNLKEQELLSLLSKLAKAGKMLLINISNRNSLHGCWVQLRGFRAKFCFTYTPRKFESILEQAGFDVIHKRGIGLITPISLFKGFKGKLIPVRAAKVVNEHFDPFATKMCHLYYIEAISGKFC